MADGRTEKYDRIIIGAGLYGCYAAEYCGGRGEKVLLLEYDGEPFMRASYINQARVHNGYHYPRSLSTALKSAGYYCRFHEDFGFCIHHQFRQIYATSSQFSWTSGSQFKEFCQAAGIYCREEPASVYFRKGTVDGAFLTEEDTYDALVLRDYYLDRFREIRGLTLECGIRLSSIRQQGDLYEVSYTDRDGGLKTAEAGFVLNATYASCNQVLRLLENEQTDGKKAFGIKYELCEIILCRGSDSLKDYGFTVMDGPFFSVMPFGQSGLHSLTSVTFTPHKTSYNAFPVFSCQEGCDCTPEQLNNCNDCQNRPESAWVYMKHLADKYLLSEYSYTYEKSLFSMKPILKSSEVDDSRPTVIHVSSRKPAFISVLSGKINTVYDLDEYLQ